MLHCMTCYITWLHSKNSSVSPSQTDQLYCWASEPCGAVQSCLGLWQRAHAPPPSPVGVGVGVFMSVCVRESEIHRKTERESARWVRVCVCLWCLESTAGDAWPAQNIKLPHRSGITHQHTAPMAQHSTAQRHGVCVCACACYLKRPLACLMAPLWVRGD